MAIQKAIAKSGSAQFYGQSEIDAWKAKHPDAVFTKMDGTPWEDAAAEPVAAPSPDPTATPTEKTELQKAVDASKASGGLRALVSKVTKPTGVGSAANSGQSGGGLTEIVQRVVQEGSGSGDQETDIARYKDPKTSPEERARLAKKIREVYKLEPSRLP